MRLERLRSARGAAHAAVLLALAALYLGAAKLGLGLAFAAAQVSPVWPPSGLALAAVLLLGPRCAPGIALGAFVANVTAAEPPLTAAGIALGNTLEALVGGWLLRRGGFSPALTRLSDVLRLTLFAAAASSALAATLGVGSLCLGGVQPWERFADLWMVWWQGDAMGALVVAPLLLTWLSPAPQGPRHDGELAVLVGGVALVCWLVFFRSAAPRFPAPSLEFAAFPFLVWAGLRHGPRGVTLATFVTAAVAIAGTVEGGGPFAGRPTNEALMLLQAYMAVEVLTGLLLAAAIAERDEAERRRAVQAEAEVGAVRESEARLRRLEGELQVRVRQLAEADQRKDEFLAILSHELRNPLAAIGSATHVLRAAGDLAGDRSRRMVEVLERQVRRLARMVDDLLEVARITRGELALRRERVDLREVASAAAEQARGWLNEGRHQLLIALPAAAVEVEADPARLEQVIANLLHNSAKYTDPGGTVRLTVAVEPGQALVSVRDDGIGIDAELLPRIFEPFVQGDRSPARSRGGLGVGLTLVQRIVGLHGGRVEASSAGRGQGTEVVVRLPRDRSPAG
jgi:signal transduction histidine kinase